ncbi:MAG TPA: phosphotransferase, partial [Negativicutes bacterium]|nr:phosphotransferase [Negativicutes bacterium]
MGEQMKDVEILECFRSKRNRVCLVKLRDDPQGRLAVLKEYRSEARELPELEYQNLKRLRENGILVPEVIGKADGSLLLEHIPGITAAELAEGLDTGEWLEGLALWLSRLHSIRTDKGSLLKGDTNLRNFIYSSGKIYGLDFEEEEYGDPRKDLGNLCFFILTDTPSFRREKYEMTRKLLRSYEKYSGTSLGNMGRFLLQSRAEAKIRRAG